MSRKISSSQALRFMLLDCMVSRRSAFWQVFRRRKVVARLMCQRQPGQPGSLSGRQFCGLAPLGFEHGQGMVCGTTESGLAGSELLQGESQAWWRRVRQQVLHLSECEVE